LRDFRSLFIKSWVATHSICKKRRKKREERRVEELNLVEMDALNRSSKREERRVTHGLKKKKKRKVKNS
jgi:hypothetical protein